MPSFEFRLIPAPGCPPFRRADLGRLHISIAERLPLLGLTTLGHVSDLTMAPEQGLGDGLPPPEVEGLMLHLDGAVSQERARIRRKKW